MTTKNKTETPHATPRDPNGFGFQEWGKRGRATNEHLLLVALAELVNLLALLPL